MISLIRVAIFHKFFFSQMMQNYSNMSDQLKIVLYYRGVVIDCFSVESVAVDRN